MGKRRKKEGWMIPGREKLAMVMGSGSVQALNTYVATFLSTYLLMTGISPVVAAGALLVLKLWDSVNDVVFGYFVDKIRFKPGKNAFTKWLFGGRYLPWFRMLFLLVPFGTIIIFSISTELPMGLRVAQFMIGYFLFDAGCTITGALGLLPLSTTDNYDERNFLLAWTGLGQGFGSLPVVFLGNMFIAGSLGYQGAALIFSLLGLFLAMFPALFVKERNAQSTRADETQQEKYTIRDMLKTLKEMPELMWLLAGTFLWGIFYTGGYGLFVSYYIFGDANLSVILSAFAVLPTIVLVPFLPAIYKRVDKARIARLCCTVFVICGIFMNLLGAEFFKANLQVLYLITVIQSTSYVLTMFAGGQLIMDLVEMAKYRTGREVGGIVSSLYSLVTKLVNSLVGTVTLLILTVYGWQSVEADSFQQLAELNAQGIGLQTEHALEGLWNVSYLFPVIGFALAAVAFSFVRIGRKDTQIYMSANSGAITREEAEEQLSALNKGKSQKKD